MSKKKNIPELRFPEFVKDGEWEEKKVEKYINLLSGIALKSEELSVDESGIPILRGINITEGYIRHSSDIDKYFLGDIENLNKYFVKENDIVIGMDGSKVGKNVALIKKEDENSILIQRVARIRTNEKLDVKFIYQHFISDKFRGYVDTVNTSSGIPHISAQQIKDYKIEFPPKLKEQQKIASCLFSLDELIAAHNDKLDALKDHKKGLMQNLFPQEEQKAPNYRFPEFTDSLRKSGFAELGEIKIGLTHKPDYIDSGIPFLSSRNISGGFIDFINIQHISKEKFESMPASTKPKVGDILFTRVGSNLGNPIILDVDIKFGIFVSLGFFRVNKKAHNYYIKYWMESDLFWKQVNQKVAGGAKDNLNSNWLKEFELYIPSINEQQKIAFCLSALDELIIVQTEKTEQLKLHKKGLMQGLFPKIVE